MSATGLEVFDKTIQTTNIWLNEIMEDLGPDRQRAYRALRAVLHALRDRLPLGESAQLGAQLPILVRGIYFDSWNPGQEPARVRREEDFIALVDQKLEGVRPMNPEAAARAVFKVLRRHVSEGEVEEVIGVLPGELQQLWH